MSFAQQSGDSSVFSLGQVEVTGSKELPLEARNAVLSAQDLADFERRNLATALNLLPGVSLNGVAGRNELGVYVRGFDLRQVPLFIDGIPVYVPYDGYVDLARFTTFDLGQITLSKGLTSSLYGPNALGGAINVVSRRPQQPFEADATVAFSSGEGRTYALNAGTKQARWYGQVGYSFASQDYFRLSDHFHPVTATEDGGARANSLSEDKKISAKVGYTPNATDEYALGVSRQNGQKGVPPYTGIDPTVRPRFWRWPQWDKDSVYFISHTALGSDTYLKPRFFYDTFQNTLDAFDNATYSTRNLASSFRSIYDDYTYGGSVELGTTHYAGHTLKSAAHYKYDVHREHNVGSPETQFRDRTWSVAVEDTYRFNDTLSAVGGLALEGRQSVQAQNLSGTTITDFSGNRNHTLNPQLGLFYSLDATHVVEVSVARKSRFPTVKDRYSYRLGQAVPNPALVPEHALHYELAYRAQITPEAHVQASVFLSRIDDTIQRVDRVSFAANGSPLFQLQNVGQSEHRGIELAGDYNPATWLRLAANYTYLKRENKSNPSLRLIDTPEHKALAYFDAHPWSHVHLIGSYEYNSSRFSSSNGLEVGSFSLVNVKAMLDLPHGLEVSVGVDNAFDRFYQLTEGYPERGRSWFASLAYRY